MAEHIQKSITDMMELFNSKMAAFQEELQNVNTAPTVASLSAEFQSFKSFITGALTTLHQQVELLTKQQDQLEMQGRRKILLLHGVAEGKKEDTALEVVKIVTVKLQIPNFTVNDISRCHRMGQTSSDKPRPILFKLRDVGVKKSIWFAKTCLKDTGITLSEFLTKVRHDAFMLARQRFGVTNCWTRDGYVIICKPDGTRHRVFSIADVNSLAASLPVAAAVPASAPSIAGTAATASKPGVSKNKRHPKK